MSAVVTPGIVSLAGRRAATPSLPAVTLYAAYGTNMDPRQMGERCPHSPLQRHRLARRAGG